MGKIGSQHVNYRRNVRKKLLNWLGFATKKSYGVVVAEISSKNWILNMPRYYLFKRDKNYYMRAYVPADLIEFIGRKEIWRSLKATRKDVARRRLRETKKDVDNYFIWAREQRDTVMESLAPAKKRKRRPPRASAETPLQNIKRDLKEAHAKWGKASGPTAIDLPATLARDYPDRQVSEFLPLLPVLKAWAKKFPHAKLQQVLVAVQNERQRGTPADVPKKARGVLDLREWLGLSDRI